MQGNIVILKHCDAIKGMATGVLQEAMTQICRWGGYFPCKICSDCHFCRQNLKTKFSKFLPLTSLGLGLVQLYFSYSSYFDMNLKKRYVATN